MSKREVLKSSEAFTLYGFLVPAVWGKWPISPAETRPSFGYLGPS